MVEGRTKEGFRTTKSFLHREPRVFRDLLHRVAQATIGYLKAQVAAGATAVQLFDTWCGELEFSEYQALALPAVQEVVRGVIDSAPVIYYTKASHHLLPAVVESGANVLSVDWRVNLSALRKLAGPRVGIQGNLDPALLYAPQDVLRAKTMEILQQLGGVGHILNLGHGILPTTPVENAQLFIQTGQEASFGASTTASVVR
jgi:uroporphyrinogen decarboxylase